MDKRHALGMLGGITAVGLGVAGLSWGQGRLRYLSAETRPTVTPLPNSAGQPQRFILTFDNGWTVNEVGRDGTVAETDYRVYPNPREVRPERGEERVPAREEETPPLRDRVPSRDDDPPAREERVPEDSDAGDGDRAGDGGADVGVDRGADDGTGEVTENDRGLRLKAK